MYKVKGKVALFFFLIKHHLMEVKLHEFVTSALDVGGWLALCPSHALTLGKELLVHITYETWWT
jgi:hypothetical protein